MAQKQLEVFRSQILPMEHPIQRIQPIFDNYSPLGMGPVILGAEPSAVHLNNLGKIVVVRLKTNME